MANTTRTSAFIFYALFLTAFGFLSASAADKNSDDTKPGAPKKSLEAASKDILKFYTAQPNNGHQEGAKISVSEYQIEGLWEQMRMQLFRLDRSKSYSLSYLLADGQLTQLKIPTHGGAGLMKGAVHENALYLTSEWGSGILRTSLYQIRSDKNGKIQIKHEGAISSSPPGVFDKTFLEDKTVKKVMTLLRPLKRGKAVNAARK